MWTIDGQGRDYWIEELYDDAAIPPRPRPALMRDELDEFADHERDRQRNMLRSLIFAVLLIVVACALLILFWGVPEADADDVPVTTKSLPEAPRAKIDADAGELSPAGSFVGVAKPVARERRVHVTWLDIGSAAAVTFDGVTTARYMREYPYGVERDPVTRILIGRHPTYATMIPFGAAEVVGAALLARRFPRAKWIQIGMIGGHTIAGAGNLRSYAQDGRTISCYDAKFAPGYVICK